LGASAPSADGAREEITGGIISGLMRPNNPNIARPTKATAKKNCVNHLFKNFQNSNPFIR